ncbi:vpu protein [Human immunodeficiency virus 1]|uniref:Protein Vpu n=1 Tax=Human immunodeficiency virus type 1 group O (isolate ANT70) TaxID=327105 RepID=VPU_HV1AN|nr:RecName: Full=Protein Vpu; AltName: Full=U ORF protein; AltName: Full=Viral protein U [HIV-1 O_ANT70]AAA99882.1 vpu protein [Human immunodeficiency virus 1]
MHHRDLLAIIIISALLFINVILWGFILRKYLEQKEQDRKEREILERLRRIREIRDDSDYESNGEEEQEVMDLVLSHGFDNPMFEP